MSPISAAYEMIPKGDGTFVAKPSKPVQWISTEAAAKALGISRWTVIRSLKSGKIKGRKVSAKLWQVDASALS